MKTARIALWLSCLLWIPAMAFGQSIAGVWKVVSDKTPDAGSQVELYTLKGKLFGKIVRQTRAAPGARCVNCPADRKNQPVVGMIVVVDMVESGGRWESGRLLDTDEGKWYDCKLWFKQGDSNTLVVRGYQGAMFRTQNWYRVR